MARKRGMQYIPYDYEAAYKRGTWMHHRRETCWDCSRQRHRRPESPLIRLNQMYLITTQHSKKWVCHCLKHQFDGSIRMQTVLIQLKRWRVLKKHYRTLHQRENQWTRRCQRQSAASRTQRQRPRRCRLQRNCSEERCSRNDKGDS